MTSKYTDEYVRRLEKDTVELRKALTSMTDACDKAFAESGYPSWFHNGTLSRARYLIRNGVWP